MWGLSVVLPENIRSMVLSEFHQQHHGIVRMKSLARVHIWYPNIDKDIETVVITRTRCKRVENQPPSCTNHAWAWPSAPMDRIHIVFFGPLFNKTVLIMVDSYSKWVDVGIMNSTNPLSTIAVCRSREYIRVSTPRVVGPFHCYRVGT